MESLEFHIPRFNELPRVPLYKDQVITYLENLVKSMNIESDEKLLTPTMLNNYVKQKVVSPPKDKKYNEKQVAYNYFCSEVEQAIKAVFSTRDFSYPIATGTITNESQILRSTVMAVANRIFIKSKLQEKKSS